MPRLDMNDTPANAVLRLVGEDKPAAAACIAMVKAVEKADPKATFGPFTPLLILDQFAIYGGAIAVFYVRVCGGDPVKALAVLHAARLGVITKEELKRAIAGRGPRLDTEMVLDLIRSRVEGFGRTED